MCVYVCVYIYRGCKKSSNCPHWIFPFRHVVSTSIYHRTATPLEDMAQNQTEYEKWTQVGCGEQHAPHIKQFKGPDPKNAWRASDSTAIDRLGPWMSPSQALFECLFRGVDGKPANRWDYYPTKRTHVGTTRAVWCCRFFSATGEQVAAVDGLRLVGAFNNRVFFKIRA